MKKSQIASDIERVLNVHKSERDSLADRQNAELRELLIEIAGEQVTEEIVQEKISLNPPGG